MDIKKHQKKIILICVALILIMSMITSKNWPYCGSMEYIHSNVTIKTGERKIIGFNADTDSLKFGVVSPGAVVTRSAEVNKSAGTKVKVFMEGELFPWTNITPSHFIVNPNEEQKIVFELHVPKEAKEGVYEGRVKFCFT